MKTAVVGMGSMGLLFAGKLVSAGVETIAVTRTVEQAQILQQQGLCLVEGQEKQTFPCSAVPISHWEGQAELLLLTVKQNVLPQVLQSLSPKLEVGCFLVPLLNGMGHWESIAQALPQCRLVQGITSEGAMRLAPNLVRRTGRGSTVVTDCTIAATLCRSGFAVEVSENIHVPVWEKFIVNCTVNPITALFEVTNGRLLSASFQGLIQSLVAEGVEVACAAGIPLRKDMVRMVLDVCRATSENHSSMWQDIEEKRETEIEALNGYMVRQGRQFGVSVPHHQVMWEQIRIKQSLRCGDDEESRRW